MIPVAASREGATLVLRLPRYPDRSEAQAAAQDLAFNGEAGLLSRTLAAVAAGVMSAPVAEAMLRDTPELQAAALALLERGGAAVVGGPVVELRVSLNEGGG